MIVALKYDLLIQDFFSVLLVFFVPVCSCFHFISSCKMYLRDWCVDGTLSSFL